MYTFMLLTLISLFLIRTQPWSLPKRMHITHIFKFNPGFQLHTFKCANKNTFKELHVNQSSTLIAILHECTYTD